jgi:uncharacterized protein (DUF2141 family)
MTGFVLPRRLAVGLAAVTLLAAGCGGGASTASGTVTFDGTPIDNGAITFVPETPAKDQPKVSEKIYDGKYTIDATRGLLPGKYKVEINWNKKTGRKMSTGSDGLADETKEGLPAKYYGATTSLTAEIKGGSNTVDFKLTK